MWPSTCRLSVHKIRQEIGRCLRMVSRMMRIVLLGGMYGGRSCRNLFRRCIAASMPSLCEMLVYKYLTLAVTMIALGGRGDRVEMICSRC